MSRFLQSASALTVAAALAAAPLVAAAQTTESETEQAVESTAQEVEQGAEQAGQEVEQAVEGAAQEVEEGAEQAGQAAEGEAQEVEVKEVEVEVQEGSGETAQTLDPNTEVVVQGTGEGTGEAPVEEVEGTIRLQDENSILTSDLMKASVFSATGEKVGDIDDAILSLDGTVEGVVIGVGGFLGIGEKHVAVEMQQLSVQMDEDNEPQLIIDTTREALEAAPDFVTAEDQREEAEAQAMQQAPAGTAPAGGGMMTSDPATGMAPAAPATEVAPAPAEGEPVKQD